MYVDTHNDQYYTYIGISAKKTLYYQTPCQVITVVINLDLFGEKTKKENWILHFYCFLFLLEQKGVQLRSLKLLLIKKNCTISMHELK